VILLTVSHRTLKILAATIWYTGSLILIIKGGQLLLEAEALIRGLGWPWAAIVFGGVLGGLKAKYIFNRSCRRNLARIASLKKPRLWQFYSPGFFLALAVMITAGIILSRLAHGHYPFLIGVAVLDIAIATALILSSNNYWKQ
jgi:hypothetical protein